MSIVEIPLRGRYGHGKAARIDGRFAEVVGRHKWYLSHGYATAKIGGVTVYLHRLILALAAIPIAPRIDHVNRDTLDCRLENLLPRPAAQSTGPIFNPHPIRDGDGAQHLSAIELDESERRLGAYLIKRHRQLERQADETLWLATARIVRLTIEGLTKTRAAWWSSLGEWDVGSISRTLRMTHVGPKPPRHPAAGDLWRDTRCRSHVVREYSLPSTWRIVLDNISPEMSRRAVRSLLSTLLSDVEVRVRWTRLSPLDEAITIMLADRMGRAGQNGRPAYLACATLAALLEVETQQVVDWLAQCRRTLTSASRGRAYSEP